MAFSLFSALALVALHLTLTSDLHAEKMGVKISQERGGGSVTHDIFMTLFPSFTNFLCQCISTLFTPPSPQIRLQLSNIYTLPPPPFFTDSSFPVLPHSILTLFFFLPPSLCGMCCSEAAEWRNVAVTSPYNNPKVGRFPPPHTQSCIYTLIFCMSHTCLQ